MLDRISTMRTDLLHLCHLVSISKNVRLFDGKNLQNI